MRFEKAYKKKNLICAYISSTTTIDFFFVVSKMALNWKLVR